MVNMPDDYPRLPQRRPALRSVPSTERHVAAPAPAPIVRPLPQPDDSLAETLRKLWRRKMKIAAVTIALGGAAAAIAWSMPSFYTAEARVLVGVQSPRVLNAEAILTDANPDAERVQNEGYVLQSRTLAHMVIDKLKLDQNPSFNPDLRQPSIWARIFNVNQYLPQSVQNWLKGMHTKAPSTGKVMPITDNTLSPHDNRMVDVFLSMVDVSLLGRSHVLSVKADALDANTASAMANTLADTYLDFQRKDKVATMDRVDKFLMGRVAELRAQVKKSDQAVEDYRRAHGLYKGSGTNGNVTAQQLTELNTQLIAAQTAKVEAESRLQEAQVASKGGAGASRESVPEVLRSPLISALKAQQADAERKAAEAASMYGSKHPLLRAAQAEAGSASARVNAEIAKTVDGLQR